MQIYKHTQIATLTLVGLGLAIVLLVVLFVLAPAARIAAGIILALLFALLLVFHGLTVEVKRDELVAAFGLGLIRKRFRIADIHDARSVRNPWYYGWGIRLTPHGWMFNVSGLDAVELDLSNNRKFRIGTDEPGRLVASIHTARELSGQQI
jgi:hypothetical protein